MTDSNKTLIAALLDRSGSMSTSKRATEDGWAELINEQSQLPGTVLVTLAQFDDRYEIVYSPTDIHQLPEFTVQPRGMTAMLDAVGKFITDVGASLSATAEENRPGQVIAMIMTDGHENASKEWTWDKVKELITQQRDVYQWRFIFLGASIDAVAVAADMGIGRGDSLTYDSQNYAANVGTFAVASASIVNTRSGLADGFTDTDRDTALGKKGKKATTSGAGKR